MIAAVGLGRPSSKAQEAPGQAPDQPQGSPAGQVAQPQLDAATRKYLSTVRPVIHGSPYAAATRGAKSAPHGASRGPLDHPNMNRQHAATPALAGSVNTLKPQQAANQTAPAPAARAKSQEDEDIDPRIIRQANRLFPWASQQEQRTQYIIDQMNSAADRQQGNSYSLRIRR